MQATIIYSKSDLPEDDSNDPRNEWATRDGQKFRPSTATFIRSVGGVRPDRPDLYEVVTTVELDADTEEQAAGKLFEQFNIGDRAGCRCRSMSVGDVIKFDTGKSLVVKGVGWGEVESPL